MANLVMQEVHNIKMSINTSASGAENWAVLGAGIDNLQEQMNEVVQQYKFLVDEGYSRSRVTGMAPIWTVSGRRIWGDAAQDYIMGMKYKVGGDRYTNAKVEYTAGGKTYSITFDCTIANIQEIGGATEENSAISFEIHVNGKPMMTSSAAGA